MHLDTLLRDKGFFEVVDYTLDAFTEDGKVVFVIDLYRDVDIAATIVEASDEFLAVPEFLDIGLAQLEAESEKSVVFGRILDVKNHLLQLNRIEWNATTVYQVEDDTLKIGGKIDVKKLLSIFDYEGIKLQLRPLYRQVAGITLIIGLSDIADTYGGFVSSEAYETDRFNNLIGTVRLREKIDQSKLNTMMKDTINELREMGGYSRLTEMLRDSEKIKNPPSTERTFRDTGIQMTKDTWRDLASPENLETLLKEVHFELRYT